MANEFKIKNGYLSEGNSQITGSLIVTGSLTVVGPTTSTQIGAGAAPSGSVPLDVRAQGALSTDIAFRVRNSADSANIFEVRGDGNLSMPQASKLFYFGAGSGTISTSVVENRASLQYFNLQTCYLSTPLQCETNSLNKVKQLSIGGAYDDNEASAIFYNIVGTPAVVANTFKMYSNDIVAGNACPHFKTEAGNIIKLYKETTAVAAAAFVANTSLIANDSATFGGYTMGQVVAALKAQGLLA